LAFWAQTEIAKRQNRKARKNCANLLSISLSLGFWFYVWNILFLLFLPLPLPPSLPSFLPPSFFFKVPVVSMCQAL
jgi:hypothetical protein